LVFGYVLKKNFGQPITSNLFIKSIWEKIKYLPILHDLSLFGLIIDEQEKLINFNSKY